MNLFNLFFVFALGAIIGWILEFFWRLIQERKRTPFGFCYGPYLPIYGFGTAAFYIISLIQIPVWSKLILFPLTSTILELATGLLLLKFNTKLWDYSQEKWNYKGVISAFHCFLWVLLGIIFYYVLFPIILIIENSFQHIAPITLLLIFYIIFCIDVFFSVNEKIKRV